MTKSHQGLNLKDSFDLRGHNALVTGGGRGLGRSMALGLAEKGANVALLDIDYDLACSTQEEIQNLGVKSFAIQGDVSQEEAAERSVKTVADTWGSLDILVNNAGIGLQGPAESTTVDDFQHLYKVDVLSVFLFCRAAFQPMSQQKSGSIINIASMCGMTVLADAPQVAYSGAKSAVIMTTKALAVEWAKYGIRVNAIVPGYFITPPVIGRIMKEQPDLWESMVARVPMGRAGDPDELKGAAVFLASDASSYMTGSILVIDGGHTCI